MQGLRVTSGLGAGGLPAAGGGEWCVSGPAWLSRARRPGGPGGPRPAHTAGPRAGRGQSTQGQAVSTSGTLFWRGGQPSQAEPARDAPAPRVGALALPLVLQRLVPEVLILGAASGLLSLRKQIWEREGLPVRLRTKQTGSARDPGRTVRGETELPAPCLQDRHTARGQMRGPGLSLQQQKPRL